MPEKKPPLTVELALFILRPALKKRLLFRPYVPLQRYLGCYEIALETGVVLGHMFRDMMPSFARLFSRAGHEEELIGFIQQSARDKLAKARDTDSFADLAMFAEENRIKAIYRQSGLTEGQIEYAAKTLNMKPEQALKNLQGALAIGIGFGSAFPELTEELWAAAYEREIPRDEWETWARLGVVNGDEIWEALSITKREEALQSLVELHVSRWRPELLSDFKLVRR